MRIRFRFFDESIINVCIQTLRGSISVHQTAAIQQFTSQKQLTQPTRIRLPDVRREALSFAVVFLLPNS